MRLKLVLISSILAALIGAGASSAIILAFSSSPVPPSVPGLLAALTLLLPLLMVFLASIFVYRHTARRRKLQAILTSILAILMSLAIFVAASILTSRPRTLEPPKQPLPPDVGYRSCCDPCRSVQTNILLNWSQGIDDKTDVFVQINS